MLINNQSAVYTYAYSKSMRECIVPGAHQEKVIGGVFEEASHH